MPELAGHAAFVTGAGSGIGQAISLALAARGVFVWATDFVADSAAETADLIEKNGGQATGGRLDVRDEAAWRTTLAKTDDRTEALTVLVNCAGTFAVTDTFSMELAEFQ